jgi:hypothetical protein
MFTPSKKPFQQRRSLESKVCPPLPRQGQSGRRYQIALVLKQAQVPQLQSAAHEEKKMEERGKSWVFL